MSEVVVNKVAITLRSLEPVQLDQAASLLIGALKEEGVSFVISLPKVSVNADGRKVGATVTLFDDLDAIDRRHLMSKLQNIDFTKNVDVSVAMV